MTSANGNEKTRGGLFRNTNAKRVANAAKFLACRLTENSSSQDSTSGSTLQVPRDSYLK